MNAGDERANGGITGVILAGGRSRRMGGTDKGLIELAGWPMVAHVATRLRPQVDELVINANRNAAAYAEHADRIVADTLEGFLGPLAGVLAGMSAAHGDRVVTAPCDSPFVPPDLVGRLCTGAEANRAEIAVAHDGERQQPVFLLAATALGPALAEWLHGGGRKIDAWFAGHRVANVDFSDCPEAFLNINTAEDRARIEVRLQESSQ